MEVYLIEIGYMLSDTAEAVITLIEKGQEGEIL
jgi:hypothetical protein